MERAGRPGRYRHDWELFVDWCTATDQVAMPADPGTLIGFLDAHPAARATNRRRLTAIRWTHQHARALAPHPTTQLRSRVLPDTSRRVDVETIRPLLQEMPTSGWTAGLVGRRDALLLVLAAHGVPYAAMERLRRCDAVVDENRCLVVTLPNSTVRIVSAPADPRTCPVAVYLRWARLLPTTTGIPPPVLWRRRCVPRSLSVSTRSSGARHSPTRPTTGETRCCRPSTGGDSSGHRAATTANGGAWTPTPPRTSCERTWRGRAFRGT